MRRLLAASAGTVLGVLALTLAARTGPQAQPDDARPTAPLGKALIMLVQTDPDLTKASIVDRLYHARTILKAKFDQGKLPELCAWDTPPSVRMIPAAVHETLNAILKEEGASPVVSASRETVAINQLPHREMLWEFRIPPQRVLTSLEIEFKSLGKKTFKVENPDVVALASLYPFQRNNSYILRLDDNQDPKAYLAHCVDPDGKLHVFKGEWPKSPRFFVITLNNFQGKQEQLFHTLMNEIPDPFKAITPSKELTFVFAFLGDEPPHPGDGIEGTNFVVRIPGLPRPFNPRRVWMLFPLTPDAMQAELKNFLALDAGEKVIDSIKLNSVNHDQPAKLAPKMKPRWFELTDASGGKSFERSFPLEDPAELRKEYPQAWRLIVYEFDENNIRSAITLQHPNGARVRVLEQEVLKWPLSVEQVLRTTKATKGK